MYNKIIICDISNTLLTSDGKIDFEIIDLIKELNNRNIGFVLCSGGPRVKTLELADAIGASKYVISSNGADVYSGINNINIYSNNIDIDTVKLLYDRSKDYDLRIAFNSNNTIYTNRKIYNKSYEKEISEHTNFSNIVSSVVQCIVSGYNHTAISEFLNIIDGIPNICFAIKNISGNNVDINDIKLCYADIVNANTTKGNGLIKLCNYLKIDKKNIISIGDNRNDISLFENSGYNVAMGNAIDELKSISDYVTLSNNEAGVSDFLKKMIKRM